MRRTCLSLLVLSLAGLLAGAPATGLTTSMSDAAPTGSDVALAYDTATDVGGYLLSHGSAPEVAIGQTFWLADDLTLDAISLGFEGLTPVGGEQITLWIGVFPDADTVAPTHMLRGETGFLPHALEAGDPCYLTIDVADLVLTGGRQYGFLLFFEGGGNVNDNRAEIKHVGADLYSGGRAFQHTTADYEALPFDLVFYLHSTTEVAVGDALVLRGGRFAVTAAWRDYEGRTGNGWPISFADASGFFWFFDPENVELVVKVLDACGYTGTYWFYAGGLTDVELTLTVRDTWTGQERVYENDLGHPFTPVTDTLAFATCGASPPSP